MVDQTFTVPLAADLAAVLVERGLGGDAIDLAERLERYGRERGGRAGDMRRLAEGWARTAERSIGKGQASATDPLSPGLLLAFAWGARRCGNRNPAIGNFAQQTGHQGALAST